MKQLNEDLKTLELGPMTKDELEHMRRIGDHVYRNESALKAQFKSFKSVNWRGVLCYKRKTRK